MTDSAAAGTSGKTTLHLLDSATGRSVHSWTFDDVPVIRMGRSGENQVVVADPSVSRFHAELRYDGTRWEVVSVMMRPSGSRSSRKPRPSGPT